MVECFKSSKYTAPQWGTCLTDTYIRQKSRQKYQCEDQSRTYCYYQCMLEVRGKVNGDVTDDCKCNIGATPPSTLSPQPTLPSWCSSPSGSDCSWYRECLEKRHPCSGKPGDYGIAYAEQFCKLYSSSYSKFNLQGKAWVDAVRKCLQVALVPMLRPYQNPTCEKIRDFAFKSHTQCYLSPFPGAPSICDLSIKDWWQVFWTIKGSFTQSLESFQESVKGVLQTATGCGKRIVKDSYDIVVKQIQLVMKVIKKKVREKRSIQHYFSNSDDKIAGHIAASIAKQLRWDSRVMDWFPLAVSNLTNNHTLVIRILLGDKYAVGLVTKSEGLPPTDLNKTVSAFVTAVKNGTLRMKTNRNSFQEVVLTSVGACVGISCKNTYLEAKAHEPNRVTKTQASLLMHILALAMSFCVTKF